MKTIALGILVWLVLGCSSDDGFQGGGRGAPGGGGAGGDVTDEEPEVPPDPAFDDDPIDPLATPEESP